MADIHTAMLAVMREVPVIRKEKTNPQQGFKFRGIDQVYTAMHDLMAKHGIYTTSRVLEEKHEERQSKKGGVLITRLYHIEYTFHAADGTSVSTVTVGEGMDSGDKGSNKAFAIAHKYALLQAFLVPTENIDDPDNESHEAAQTNNTNTGDDF